MVIFKKITKFVILKTVEFKTKKTALLSGLILRIKKVLQSKSSFNFINKI